jgi:hypothetical protein
MGADVLALQRDSRGFHLVAYFPGAADRSL